MATEATILLRAEDIPASGRKHRGVAEPLLFETEGGYRNAL